MLAAAGHPRPVQDPGFALGHLGASWRGLAVAGAVRVRYRAGLAAWQPLTATESGEGGRRLSLQWVGSAEAYEVRAAPAVRDLRLPAVNTTDGPATPARLAAPTPLDGLGPTVSGPVPRFSYLSRAGWGADESWRFGPDGSETFPARYFPVQTLAVHHTVTANADPDPAATVRAIYFHHAVTEDWGDSATTCWWTASARCTRAAGPGPTRFPCSVRGRSGRGRRCRTPRT